MNSLKINNASQNIYERIFNHTLRLDYDEPYITLGFTAHDFINNENCEFSYRIIDFADEWIYNENNPNIVITKLPPGKYKLEVKCKYYCLYYLFYFNCYCYLYNTVCHQESYPTESPDFTRTY